MAFVHLRIHTEFSIVDGSLRIDDAVAAAAADAQGALAITDLANLFGAIKFYSAARKRGIKPIIGADLWLEPEGAEKAASRLVVLVQNSQGYHHLCELLSRAWLRNVQRAQACVTWDWLAELGEGLIVLSGAEYGPVGQALVAGDRDRAALLATRLARLFKDRFYIELQRAGLPGNEAHVRAAVQLAAELKLPVVATHPVQFATADDFEAHEARVCVSEGELLSNPKRAKRFCEEQYFKTQAQMEALFADLPSAVRNTVEIARRCNLGLVLGQAQLPDFPTPVVDGVPLAMDAYFRIASHEGLEKRLAQLYPDAAVRKAERARYVERLDFEIATILKMGFPGYFLIVADFINWAQNNGCPVGPGRGSGAGSLVAYAMGITGLDPLQYNLLFERFLNPERVSMPDFDIDFCQGNRERVIDYVKQKYGRDAVSQIATFGTMAAKAALRDVGRVLGMGYGHVDSIAKLIPAPPGKQVTLARVPAEPEPGLIYARKEAPELEQREAAEEEVAELLRLAMRVEGLTRNVGMHAGGVLIAPGKITDFCPLYMQPGSDSAVSQFDKDDVEAIGLVKFDFLGLATLTILELAKEFIKARRPQHADFDFANFDYERLPLDDERVYKLFSDGRTESVFQFESPGMQRMLKDARPTRIEDLIALNAMFRPGPMENIPTFCARKHGKEEVSYPHPLLETVLGETYGVMVYQEQVMQAAQVLGGYSLGGADLLRRAMGKKKAEEMATHRAIFRDGAAVKHISPAVADEVFDLMEKFAGYGFNKSHAAAYALLAYHTAYLKVHHPAAFFAANMSASMDDTDKVQILAADAMANGVKILAPDINRSEYRFRPTDPVTLRYGLGGIKGSGQGAIESIIGAREKAPFTSLFDFTRRVDKRLVNRRTIESLVRAGAFDAQEPDRAALLASVGIAMEAAEQAEQSASQVSLFGGSGEAADREPELLHTLKWTERDRLLNEKMALGYFLSGHLFDAFAPEVRRLVKTPLAGVVPREDAQLLAGVVTQIRVVMTRRGKMIILELDDGSAKLEVTLFQELMDQHRDILKPDELLVIAGRVREDRFSGAMRINAERIMSLADLRRSYGRGLRLSMNGQANTKKLMELLGPYRNGPCPVTIEYANGTARCTLQMPDSWRVTPREELLAGLRDWLSPAGAEIVY